MENIAVGSVIVKVSATDADKGDSIEYSLITTVDEFSIEPASGNIILLTALDREVTDRYDLIIHATDGTNVATATVTILVSDVNDNTPKFEPASYR